MAVDARKIAILGAGQIGEALLSGLLSSGWRTAAELVGLDPAGGARRRAARAARRSPSRCRTPRRRRAPRSSSIAVKPQDIETLLGEIGPLIQPEQTVLSIAAAIPTAAIERHFGAGVPVVRAMPNTPSIVHEGMAGVCAGAHAGEEHLTLAEEALRHLGAVVRVSEPYMDAVTAVSGSGPAYFALLAEAMIEAGILLGLSREVSTQLVVQTMLGTAKQLRDLKMHPVELREMVTSPGGTTIAAIRELEQAGVRAAFLNAIQAAMDRSRELARGDLAWATSRSASSSDPAREAADAADRASRAPEATSPSPAARRSAPSTSWPRSSSPTGAGAHVWFGDERAVPPGDSRSNYRLVRTTLLDSLSRSPEVHRVRGELRREEAAALYDEELDGRDARPGAERHRARRAHGLALPRLAGARRAGAPCCRGRGRARAVRPARDDDAEGVRRDGAARLPRHRRGEGARPCKAAFADEPSPATPASLVRGRTTIAILDAPPRRYSELVPDGSSASGSEPVRLGRRHSSSG